MYTPLFLSSEEPSDFMFCVLFNSRSHYKIVLICTCKMRALTFGHSDLKLVSLDDCHYVSDFVCVLSLFSVQQTVSIWIVWVSVFNTITTGSYLFSKSKALFKRKEMNFVYENKNITNFNERSNLINWIVGY